MTASSVEALDFGFIFARVLKFYGMSYVSLMQLPISVFWFLNSHIGRLMAERDLRIMRVQAALYDSDAYQQTRYELEAEMGEIIREKTRLNLERDEAGCEQLRTMANTML